MSQKQGQGDGAVMKSKQMLQYACAVGRSLNANPSQTAITITWQRDMVVNPVGRHSGCLAFRQRSNIAVKHRRY